MKIYDISWPLSSAATGYKNKKAVTFESTKSFMPDRVRETKITLDSHSGTHVDAPAHMLENGKTIDEISLERLIGMALVLDLTPSVNAITAEDLHVYDQQINEGAIILLKTTNSLSLPNDSFDPEFVYLDSSGAAYLAQKKVKAVGIDYLGIERGDPGHATHATLMSHDVVIIEGLRLEGVAAGRYQFVCLPLDLVGIDAAPARAILLGV